jgi:hypothetical protein
MTARVYYTNGNEADADLPLAARACCWWLTASAAERWKSHAFGMGSGYDTSPQVGRCRAPDSAGGEPRERYFSTIWL